jgi:hypothetical protein
MPRSTTVTRDEILDSPAEAKAALDAAQKAMNSSPLPVADFPPVDMVTLPGGLMHKGKLIKQVMVRELTGEHEEALARAIQHPNQYHFVDTLLRSGVERAGDLSPEESQDALASMLTGDRDEILLGIRSATYGDTVEIFGWTCPECGGKVDKITFSLTDDVTRKTLRSPADESVFEVSLRRGASAKVRLATGAVQVAVFEDPDLNAPQRNDILLSKCVETYTDAHGETHLIAGYPSTVRKMSSPDRQKILRELTERQPGPRYNDVRFDHEGCGKEVSLALGITDLFRDLLLALV